MEIRITQIMEIFKNIFITIIFLFISINNTNGKVYGVFYAVNGDLNCPENDMKDLADLYRNRGAMIFLIRGESVNRTNIFKYLKKQAKSCKEEDMLVFAFSGHGCNDGISCGDGFIWYNEIVSIFNSSKACRKIIFTGACESGGIKKAANKIKLPKNGHFVAFTASRKNEYSLEEVGKRNSYFYKRVINGLKGGADSNKDRKITVKELYEYISKYVRSDVDEDDVEHPTAYGRFNDNLVLMSWIKY